MESTHPAPHGLKSRDTSASHPYYGCLMPRRIVGLFLLLLIVPLPAVALAPLTRRDGFLLLWQSIRRSIESNREEPFTDVHEGTAGYEEIRYAKYRGILDDDEETFRPEHPLQLDDALVWLFRTRSVDELSALTRENLPTLLERYPVAFLTSENAIKTVTEEEVQSLMRSLDDALVKEDHEISLYGEQFHGDRTAFGETFDMNALTAAHRTYPYNTLVKVTNVRNGKSVIVRINDRGPYVDGRDMDLSVAAFTAIEDRSKGLLRATFRRLGDAMLVDPCGDRDPRRAVRITKGVHLIGGVPALLPLGKDLVFRSTRPFVLRSVRYPDGSVTHLEDWILPGESHPFRPGIEGEYVFTVGSREGRRRELRMQVVGCD